MPPDSGNILPYNVPLCTQSGNITVCPVTGSFFLQMLSVAQDYRIPCIKVLLTDIYFPVLSPIPALHIQILRSAALSPDIRHENLPPVPAEKQAPGLWKFPLFLYYAAVPA